MKIKIVLSVLFFQINDEPSETYYLPLKAPFNFKILSTSEWFQNIFDVENLNLKKVSSAEEQGFLPQKIAFII